MKYLREIAVLALVVIAAISVYKIVHKQKHHEVEIQTVNNPNGGILFGNGKTKP